MAAASAAPSYDAAKALDRLEEVFLQEIIMAKFDPYHVLGVDYHERGHLTPGQLRQRIRTNFRSYLEHIIFIKVDSHGLLDYHRSPAFEAFLRDALQEMGPNVTPDDLLLYAQGKGPQEVRDAINAQVPPTELILLESNRQEKMLQFRVNLCRCVQEKSQQDHLEMSVPAVSSTLDNVYDAVMDHLNRSGALPRGFDVLLLIRFRTPGTENFVDVLLSRTNAASPYKWKIQLSNITTPTASVAQHLLDQLTEGAVPRFKDLGSFFPSTEIYACLTAGRAQGPAKTLKHSATNLFIPVEESTTTVVEAPPPPAPAKADTANQASIPLPQAPVNEEGAAVPATVGVKRKIGEPTTAAAVASVPSAAAGGGGAAPSPTAPGAAAGAPPQQSYPKSSGPRCTVCGEPARFKPPGGNKFVDGYCGRHAKSTMVDIRGPVCEFPGCVRAGAPVAKRATYAFKGEARPRRCSEHREHGMIDIVHKKPAASGEEGGGGEPAPKKARPHTGGAKPRAQAPKPDQGQDDMANTAVEALFTLRQGPPAGGGGGKGQGPDGVSGAMAGARPGEAGGLPVRSIEELASKLSHRDKDVRCEALRQLVGRGDQAGPIALKIAQGLKDTDTDVRKLTLEVLTQLHSVAADAIMQLNLLNDRNTDVQRWALYALGHLGRYASAHIDAIATFLTVEDKGLRQWGIYALGQVVGPEDDPYDKILPRLAECLKEDDSVLRQHVIDALRKLDWQGKHVADLVNILDLEKEKDVKVLASVVAAVESYGERAAAYADKLAMLLGSSLRESVVKALPKLGVSAVASLTKMQALMSPSPEVRVAALHVLRDLGSAVLPHVDIIKPLLGDADPSVRLAAVEALTQICGSHGLLLEDIGALVRDPNLEVQEKVLKALRSQGLRAKDFVPRMMELIEDHSNEKARRLALEALGHVPILAGPHIERIVAVLCEEVDPDMVNGAIFLLSSRALREFIAPFAQRIHAALQDPAKRALFRPDILVAAEQLRLSCGDVLQTTHGLTSPPSVFDPLPPVEPDPLDVIWRDKLLAVVVRPEIHQSFSQMDDGIYYVVQTPNSKNQSSTNKDTWELRRLRDEVEVVAKAEGTTKGPAVSEISRLASGGPGHFAGQIVFPTEFNMSPVSRGAHKPLPDEPTRHLRPERTILLTFTAPSSIRIRFEERNRDMVVDVAKAREMFMPVVEGPGWLQNFFQTWMKNRFCAGDYSALFMALAIARRAREATAVDGKDPENSLPPTRYSLNLVDDKMPLEWLAGALDRDCLSLLSFFTVDSPRRHDFCIDDFLLFINAFQTPLQDLFLTAKQVEQMVNSAMMDCSGLAIDFRPFPIARELLDHDDRERSKRVFFRLSEKYPVRILTEFTDQSPWKQSASLLPISLQWDGTQQRWAADDPGIDGVLVRHGATNGKGNTPLSRVGAVITDLEANQDAGLRQSLASRILSPWQQPLAAVVVHAPTSTSTTITPAEAQRQAEQGIYVVLEDGQRGETWTHTLVRCRDEIGMLGGQTFSMLDRQFMHFRGKVLLDEEGATEGSNPRVYQRLDVKGMRPGRRAGLWWSCGGVIRLGFMRDDAPTVVEAQHTCTEVEAQIFLTPIPVVDGWLETFLSNSPKRYCAGDYLALLQAAYLQYERRIRPRGGMETRSFESRVEEAFKTPNLKLPFDVLQCALTPASLDIVKFFIVDVETTSTGGGVPLPSPPPSESLEFHVDDFIHFLNCFTTPHKSPFQTAGEVHSHLQHLLSQRGPGTQDVFDFRNFPRARVLGKRVPQDPPCRNKDNIFFRMSDTKPLRVVMAFYDAPAHWQAVLSMPEPKIMRLKWDLVTLPEGLGFSWSVDESEIMDGIIKQAAGEVQGNSIISSLGDLSRAFGAILEDRVPHSKATVTEIMRMGSGTYLKRSTAQATVPITAI